MKNTYEKRKNTKDTSEVARRDSSEVEKKETDSAIEKGDISSFLVFKYVSLVFYISFLIFLGMCF